MSLEWKSVGKDGAPESGRAVLLANTERHQRYDVGCWRTEWDQGGYWATRGEMRAVRLSAFTHWAYFEGPA